ncbi:FAD-binding oxidoreductase [Acrocarpospora sp. B8E8]|uniref:NAD(P)/FAD-dependent oxidoreductase n=1 Tax=Acrocarpospora sp. B8E8 TaxID=3153572 RepID=UPI00325EC95F
MNSDIKAVVVGGGILGSSVALHLLRAGVKNCTLLERDRVAQATSAAGAGFIDHWAAGSSDDTGSEENALADYAIDFYRHLNAARSESPYRQRGILWMAATEQDWTYVEKRLTEGPADARAIEPVQIEAMTRGVVKASGVYRGVLRPRSAQISAERATRALGALFTAEGGHLAERTPVVKILEEGGRITGVVTPHGRIDADIVVLAAGAWTNHLLEPLGQFLQVAPLVVSRIVTEPLDLPGDLPLLFIRGHASGLPKSVWAREEDGRLLFGTVYETPARYSFADGEVPDRLDQVDLDGVLEVQRGARVLADAIPAFARYRNFRVKHGAPGFTPDGRAIVGELPGVRNLYVVAGCNEQGVTHGPGFGRVVAEQITAGKSDLADISVWRPDRFKNKLTSAREVVAAL